MARKLTTYRTVPGDRAVGLLAACCGQTIRPGEAMLHRRHLTVDVDMHLGCVVGALDAADEDLLRIPSTERFRAYVTT